MLVSDILTEAEEVTGTTDTAKIFRELTHACELLANKGPWDSLTCYMDIQPQASNLIALPPQVKSVMKCNIAKNPAFSRVRFWEFTQNTIGSNDATVGYEMLDQGRSPVFTQPDFSMFTQSFAASTGNSADDNLPLVITLRLADGNEFDVTVLINQPPIGVSFPAINDINNPLPTSDPHVIGAYWNNGGVVCISEG